MTGSLVVCIVLHIRRQMSSFSCLSKTSLDDDSSVWNAQNILRKKMCLKMFKTSLICIHWKWGPWGVQIISAVFQSKWCNDFGRLINFQGLSDDRKVLKFRISTTHSQQKRVVWKLKRFEKLEFIKVAYLCSEKIIF